MNKYCIDVFIKWESLTGVESLPQFYLKFVFGTVIKIKVIFDIMNKIYIYNALNIHSLV